MRSRFLGVFTPKAHSAKADEKTRPPRAAGEAWPPAPRVSQKPWDHASRRPQDGPPAASSPTPPSASSSRRNSVSPTVLSATDSGSTAGDLSRMTTRSSALSAGSATAVPPARPAGRFKAVCTHDSTYTEWADADGHVVFLPPNTRPTETPYQRRMEAAGFTVW